MDQASHIPKSFKIIILLLSLIAIVCLAATGAMWLKLSNAPAAAVVADTEAELEKIVTDVGAYLLLPQDETPTLLTITEAELQTLAGQAFFVNALPGDQLLVYSQNSKAVLWRPSSKKIIEASIISMSGN